MASFSEPLIPDQIHRAADLSDDLILDGMLAMAREGDTPPAVRLRAWELLAKTRGLFSDRKQEPTINIVQLTPPLNGDPTERTESGDDRNN